jgi:hypothetical protein
LGLSLFAFSLSETVGGNGFTRPDHINMSIILFGLLGLSVVRVLPVAISPIGLHLRWDSGVLFHNFPAMVYSRAPVKIKGQGLSGHILDFQMAQGPGIDTEPPEIVCED